MAKRKTETEPYENTHIPDGMTRGVSPMAGAKEELIKLSKRQYTQAPVAVDPGIPCSHCGRRYGHHITNTYPNGNRRRVCGACGKPFVSVRMTR